MHNDVKGLNIFSPGQEMAVHEWRGTWKRNIKKLNSRKSRSGCNYLKNIYIFSFYCNNYKCANNGCYLCTRGATSTLLSPLFFSSLTFHDRIY